MSRVSVDICSGGCPRPLLPVDSAIQRIPFDPGVTGRDRTRRRETDGIAPGAAIPSIPLSPRRAAPRLRACSPNRSGKSGTPKAARGTHTTYIRGSDRVMIHCSGERDVSTSRCNSCVEASSALRRGLMTMDHWGFNRSRDRRTASRTRRLMRLRTTAFPSARGVVKPICGPSGSVSRTQKAANRDPEIRVPLSYTRRKSLERSRRTRLGKPGMEYYLSELTVSFLRPLARRRDRTARPFLVSIRVRKPCVLARWRLFG